MIEKIIAIDTETTGLDWNDRLIIISIAKRTNSGKIDTLVLNVGYIQKANRFGLAFGDDADIRDKEITPLTIPEARAAFHAFIGNADTLVFHNGSFDIPFIVRSGILTERELDSYLIFDTIVWARCTAAHESVSLVNLAGDFNISFNQDWLDMKGKRKKIQQQPYNEVEKYARMDADVTLQIAEKMIPLAIDYYDDGFITEESDWIKLISLLRVRGIQTDMDAVNRILAEKKKQLAELLFQLRSYRIEGPNHRTSILRWIGIIKQTSRLLDTEKGNPSINEESLRGLTGEAVSVVRLILQARHIEKEISTWVESPLNHACSAGRLHPHFMVSGAKSNRLTCKNPSLHTIPKELEPVLFSARPGYRLASLDYEQAELRVAASYAQELALVNAFHNGDDPHMATAIRIFGLTAGKEERRKAKNCNFCSIYGGGALALMSQANKGVPTTDRITEEEAWEILDEHKKALPQIAKCQKRATRVWEARGYLSVLGGKRVYASQYDLQKSYKAFNYLIQPSVAELVKKAMVRIWKELPEVLIVNQKHDSIYFEIPDDNKFDERVEQIKKTMIEVYPEELSNRTSPSVIMAADMEINKEGLPLPQ